MSQREKIVAVIGTIGMLLIIIGGFTTFGAAGGILVMGVTFLCAALLDKRP